MQLSWNFLSLQPSYSILSLVLLPYMHITLYIDVISFYYIMMYLPTDFLPIGSKILKGRDLDLSSFSHQQPTHVYISATVTDI